MSADVSGGRGGAATGRNMPVRPPCIKARQDRPNRLGDRQDPVTVRRVLREQEGVSIRRQRRRIARGAQGVRRTRGFPPGEEPLLAGRSDACTCSCRRLPRLSGHRFRPSAPREPPPRATMASARLLTLTALLALSTCVGKLHMVNCGCGGRAAPLCAVRPLQFRALGRSPPPGCWRVWEWTGS